MVLGVKSLAPIGSLQCGSIASRYEPKSFASTNHPVMARLPGLVSDIPIYRELSVKTMNAEPSGRVPGFVFRQKNDAA